MQVGGHRFSEADIKRIEQAVALDPQLSRRQLSRQVCEWLQLRSLNGKLQEMSCRTALLRLERCGKLQLPPPRMSAAVFAAQHRTTGVELQETGALECSFSQLGPVELVAVGSRYSRGSKIWRALMRRYHPLGAGPLCGAQLRYLIRSPRHGWIGGLAFSAAAWRVGARDRWVGWSDAARSQNLNKVVCNSRFLILPQVQVKHLASHVLAVAVKGLSADWRQRYGYEPLLLETYVDRSRYRGTCYRAANWQLVGRTKGRGRQDQGHRCRLAEKDVYIYALCREVRQRLCAADTRMAPAAEKIRREAADWVEEELGGAQLGDQRLSRRLISIVRDFYACPRGSVPQATGSRAKTKAAYRFFDHPAIDMDSVLAPHYQATEQRLQRHAVVLAVQDTTSLNYTSHPLTEGLGPIGYRQDRGLGLMLHETLAFSVQGTPLGLVDVQCWARDGNQFGKKKTRHQRPIEQKESYKWLKGYKKLAEVQARCPASQLVSVGDCEADIYELFELALRDPKGPRLLVRAFHNRPLSDEQGRLWSRLLQRPVSGVQPLSVPRQGQRPSRVAHMTVRFARLRLKPPAGKAPLKDLRVWAVLAKEENAPEGVEPLEWMLLSTLQVSSFEQAVEKIAWYTQRWGIEVYHRVLKSGCKIEERQLGAVDRIEACLAVDMLVAWRIFHLTKLGRETPDVPCTVYFEDAQWKALLAYVTRNPIPPPQPPSLRQATRMMASLGGFLGRKSDKEPGTKSLWIGLQRLDDLTSMWLFMVESFVPHLKPPSVSSNPGYG
jgi:hypothetical protein